MATKKSPLGRTKDEHGTKEKLVDKLVTLLGQIRKTEEDKDDKDPASKDAKQAQQSATVQIHE